MNGEGLGSDRRLTATESVPETRLTNVPSCLLFFHSVCQPHQTEGRQRSTRTSPWMHAHTHMHTYTPTHKQSHTHTLHSDLHFLIMAAWQEAVCTSVWSSHTVYTLSSHTHLPARGPGPGGGGALITPGSPQPPQVLSPSRTCPQYGWTSLGPERQEVLLRNQAAH